MRLHKKYKKKKNTTIKKTQKKKSSTNISSQNYITMKGGNIIKDNILPDNMKFLLNNNLDLLNSEMNILKTELKKYKATPWKKYKPTWNTYHNNLKKNCKVCNTNNNKCICTTLTLCKYKGNNNNIKTKKNLYCQGHAGDLFQHSQWATLQILIWHTKPDTCDYMIFNYVGEDEHKMILLLLSTFFHDIGKAGDCIKDMYSSTKYKGEGDRNHPNYCGKLLMGEEVFKYNCDKNTNNNKKNLNHKHNTLNIRELLKSWFELKDTDLNTLALCAYMHWEFGRLNMPKDYGGIDNTQYIELFNSNCEICTLTPSEDLLRICIIVSCADISAGTNIRLKNLENLKIIKKFFNSLDDNNNIIANEIYLAKDPWEEFKMDVKFIDLSKNLILYYKQSLTK